MRQAILPDLEGVFGPHGDLVDYTVNFALHSLGFKHTPPVVSPSSPAPRKQCRLVAHRLDERVLDANECHPTHLGLVWSDEGGVNSHPNFDDRYWRRCIHLHYSRTMPLVPSTTAPLRRIYCTYAMQPPRTPMVAASTALWLYSARLKVHIGIGNISVRTMIEGVGCTVGKCDGTPMQPRVASFAAPRRMAALRRVSHKAVN